MRDTTTKDRLIESAAHVLHQRSYGSVGVDELCERAGVRKGSFYHFFESKRDLALVVSASARATAADSDDTVSMGTVPF